MQNEITAAYYGSSFAIISTHPETNYDTNAFPIRKSAILDKLKEIKELRGGILMYAAQEIPQIDTEIAQKGHFRMETN